MVVDGFSCIFDLCDEENDVIIYMLVDGDCDDGEFCIGVEFCDL